MLSCRAVSRHFEEARLATALVDMNDEVIIAGSLAEGMPAGSCSIARRAPTTADVAGDGGSSQHRRYPDNLLYPGSGLPAVLVTVAALPRLSSSKALVLIAHVV